MGYQKNCKDESMQLMFMCRPLGHIVKIYVMDAKMVEIHHVSIFLLASEDDVF